MNLDLAVLEARRTATLTAVGCTVAAALLALLQSPGPTEGAGALADLSAVETRADLSYIRSAWTAGLVVVGGWCVLRSAGLAQGWFGGWFQNGESGEGSWLAPTAPSRPGIAASAQAGIAAASALLALGVAILIGTLASPSENNTLMEPFALAGPARSTLLMPGDRFVQTFGEVRPPTGSTVRVRLTPTAEIGSGTTRVEISAGDNVETRSLVRKSWAETKLPRGTLAVSTRNIGEGSAALLGPRPVEIWSPSGALLGGHLRLWLHACALLLFLTGATLSAGLWMSPGISAAASLSLWLFLAATGFGPGWIPGTGDLGAALDALAEGRAPGNPSPWTWGAAVGAGALAALMAIPALRSWHHEGRG